MKLFFRAKDGGPLSKVTGYWLFESKKFGSISLLCFDKGSRDVYHTHAFDAISWVLKGRLLEEMREGHTNSYMPSLKPIVTRRETYHQVHGMAKKTWALTFRGPWLPRWKEYNPQDAREYTLTNGRVEVNE